MEDIEDLGLDHHLSPVGLHLPLTYVLPKPRNQPRTSRTAKMNCPPAPPPPDVPGTQTVFLKTFGCAHNQSDSEYMAGQLSAYGYSISEHPDEADLWLINTCTVKSPSQSAMETLIHRGKNANKLLVVAGCVPQGSKDLKDLDGVSIVGVQQIDRVVEVVEETLRGHEVRLLRRSSLPALDLPKVRKNKFVEILPINVGCLGACTYCKTKHARGHLGSYPISTLVERLKSVIASGVKEIWLSSEDTGAYGRDIQSNLPALLHALVAELPKERTVMLRIGMTNPPYILEHLEEIAEILCHPCVYSFLHVPVQSGSDRVLHAMKREYSVGEFRKVIDTLLKLVPGIQIATDVICGFPGESEEDFKETIRLVQEYKFPQIHISQFYPRPGTPAARMKRVPTGEVKERSRRLSSLFESFSPYKDLEGKTLRVWVTDTAADGINLVGHTESYVQVLLPASEFLLGNSVDVNVTSSGRWSVMGEVVPFISKQRMPEASLPEVDSIYYSGKTNLIDAEGSGDGGDKAMHMVTKRHAELEQQAHPCLCKTSPCGCEGLHKCENRSVLGNSNGCNHASNTIMSDGINRRVRGYLSSFIRNRTSMAVAEMAEETGNGKEHRNASRFKVQLCFLDRLLLICFVSSLISFLILLFRILRLY